MKNSHFLKSLLRSNDGIALLMVLTSVTILTALLAEFSFETKVNKIKSYNLQDKLQAKLNAEAALQFSMARLRLYKESFNYVEANSDAKTFVDQKMLNQIWQVPFVFPIPVSSKMSVRAKAAIDKFAKSSLIQGELSVTVRNISNLINLNLLRAPLYSDADDKDNSEEKKEENQAFTADFQIFDLLRQGIESKKEQDEFFEDKYASMDPNMLVSSMKYFISEKTTFEDNNTPELVSDYDTIGMELKYTPFSSKSELHLLAKWDDELINLIKDQVTAHGSVMIDLNKINSNMLKVLIPDISEEQVKEFFEYRDDNENPHFFNTSEDFKKYITGTSGIMNEDDYDERFEKLEKNGLKFGPSPTLFEINATGKYNNTIYSLTAIVSIPAEPDPSKEDLENAGLNEEEVNKEEEEKEEEETEEEKEKNENEEGKQEEKAPIIKLMEPRIQEIYVN
jgi:type II secretory pathway component PulK